MLSKERHLLLRYPAVRSLMLVLFYSNILHCIALQCPALEVYSNMCCSYLTQSITGTELTFDSELLLRIKASAFHLSPELGPSFTAGWLRRLWLSFSPTETTKFQPKTQLRHRTWNISGDQPDAQVYCPLASLPQVRSYCNSVYVAV